MDVFCGKILADNAKNIPLKTTEQKVSTRGDEISSTTLTFEKKIAIPNINSTIQKEKKLRSFSIYSLYDYMVIEGITFRRCDQTNIIR